MGILDDILARLDALPPEQLAALEAKRKASNDLFVPNPGGQTAALNSLADELFFGGEPGGGKSHLAVGAAVTRHTNSVIFRREFSQIKGLEDAAEDILRSRDGYNASTHVWRIPGTERTLEFGSVPHEKDKKRYQGRAHDLKCVGPGTPVLMADGTYKAIKNVRIGDWVLTLCGARPVTAVHHVTKPAVRVTSTESAQVSQVQSVTHELLTLSGWRASGLSSTSLYGPGKYLGYGSGEALTIERMNSGRLSGSLPQREYGVSRSWRHGADTDVSTSCLSWTRYLSTEFLRALQCVVGLRSTAQAVYSPRGIRSLGLLLLQLLWPQERGRRDWLGSCAVGLRPVGGIYSEWFADLRREVGLLVSAFFPQGRGEQRLQVSAPTASTRLLSREFCDDPTYSSLRGLTGRYWSERRHDDERARPALTDVLLVALPQDDAGQQSPTYLQGYDPGTVRRHNRCTWSYVHPYSKETRQTDLDVRVSSFHVDYIGSQALIDLTVDGENHYITQNGFINKNCFDEITHFTRSQYLYLTLWLRSADPKQRSRIIATGNPPDSPEGLWVIEHWAPWLDPTFYDPASPGELRWAVPLEEGSEKERFFRSLDEAKAHVMKFKKPPVDHNGVFLPPKSRTFIPGKLQENPDYVRTGYQAVLAYASGGLAGLAAGDFESGLKDDPWQVIPTAWIIAAQKRWTPRPPQNAPMVAIGVDVAQGGSAETVLSPRHDWWFAPLIAVPGADTPDPSDTAALVVKHRRDMSAVVVDCDGGWGGGVVGTLAANNIAALKYKGSGTAHGRTKDRAHAFVNKRAESWWRLREALDPDQNGGSPICLPDEPAIRADLAAPRYTIGPRGIQIEDKAQIVKRIGRSPDKGDAIVMSWSAGNEALRKGMSGVGAAVGAATMDRPKYANVGYASQKRRR